MHKEYRWARIIAFWHPYDHPQGAGYHIYQSLIAVGTGGFTGRPIKSGSSTRNIPAVPGSRSQ